MDKKDGLLSIGEMAKVTGAGTRALHYYERKNILKPAYIDPDSGYRYYSYNQVFFINIIKNCVEFGIPIKELAGVIDSDNADAFRNFLEQSITAIERKSRELRLANDTFNDALQKMDFAKEYNAAQIYRRNFDEKIYYVKPYGQNIPEQNRWLTYDEIELEIYDGIIPRLAEIDYLDDAIPIPDVGYLCQYSHKETNYYGFKQVPKQFVHKNTMTIPAGTYFFRQDENSQIVNAREIFKEQLEGIDSFVVIETEDFFLNTTKLSQTMYELRLIVL